MCYQAIKECYLGNLWIVIIASFDFIIFHNKEWQWNYIRNILMFLVFPTEYWLHKSDNRSNIHCTLKYV